MSPEAILPDPCPAKTRADLEWDRVLEALAARCASPAGKRLARALPFASSREACSPRSREVREASSSTSPGEPLPARRRRPRSRDALDRARIGAVLANEELRAVIACLGAARALRRFLQAPARERAARSTPPARSIPTLDELERRARGVLRPRRHARGPRVARARSSCARERRAARQRCSSRLEELMRKHEDILQDRFWTERDGRYVLPGALGRARALPRHRARDERERRDASSSSRARSSRWATGRRCSTPQVAREEKAVYAALSAASPSRCRQRRRRRATRSRTPTCARATARLAQDLAARASRRSPTSAAVIDSRRARATRSSRSTAVRRRSPSDLAIGGGPRDGRVAGRTRAARRSR